MFLRHLVPLPSMTLRQKFYGDRPRGPIRRRGGGRFNQRGVKNAAILDLSKAISWKRCKIGGKLLLMTNRKWHMSFRLVPNSVTLNDLERRNRPNGCVISPNLVVFWADCVIVSEDTRILSLRQKSRPINVVFNDILFIAILAGDHSKR